MKLKVIGIAVGALMALGLIGVGTIWAQGGTGGTPTPNNPSAASSCDQFNQALAKRLNVDVSKLTQAEKDASKDLIDQAVKDGKLTPDQANQAKQRIDQAQGTCGFGPFGHPGGFENHRGLPPFGGPKPGQPNGQPDRRPGQIITGTRGINGATLTQVVADSPAAKAGLQVGDIILAVGGQNVDAQHLLDMLIRAHKPGDSVELKIQRGSDTKTINATLGAQPNNATAPYLGIQFEYRRSPT